MRFVSIFRQQTRAFPVTSVSTIPKAFPYLSLSDGARAVGQAGRHGRSLSWASPAREEGEPAVIYHSWRPLSRYTLRKHIFPAARTVHLIYLCIGAQRTRRILMRQEPHIFGERTGVLTRVFFFFFFFEIRFFRFSFQTPSERARLATVPPRTRRVRIVFISLLRSRRPAQNRRETAVQNFGGSSTPRA